MTHTRTGAESAPQHAAGAGGRHRLRRKRSLRTPSLLAVSVLAASLLGMGGLAAYASEDESLAPASAETETTTIEVPLEALAEPAADAPAAETESVPAVATTVEPNSPAAPIITAAELTETASPSATSEEVVIPVPSVAFTATCTDGAWQAKDITSATVDGVILRPGAGALEPGDRVAFDQFDAQLQFAGGAGGIISFVSLTAHDGVKFDGLADGELPGVAATSDNTTCAMPTGAVTVSGPLDSSNPPFYDYTTSPSVLEVTPGETASLTAAPGFWTSGIDGTWTNASIGFTALDTGDSLGLSVEITPTVSLDGSTLTFTIPSKLPNAFWDDATTPRFKTTLWKDATDASQGRIQVTPTLSLVGAPAPAVEFTQTDSATPDVTISITNVLKHSYTFSVASRASDSSPLSELASITIPAGETQRVTVAAQAGDLLQVGGGLGSAAPWARYTVQEATVPTPEPTPTETPAPTPTPSPSATLPATGGDPSVELSTASSSAGGTLTVTAAGFEPNEPIEIWLHSTPVKLYAGTASSTGTVSQTVTIPTGIEAGAHRIEVRGSNSGSVFTPLTIKAAPQASSAKDGDVLPATGAGDGLLWTAGISGALLIAAGAGLFAARRNRKA